MSRVQEYLQQLAANPNCSRFLIEALNQRFAKKSKKFKLVESDDIYPCFFSGNIEEPGKVVTISLNPKYESGKTEAAHACYKDFEEYYGHCRYRFDEYETDKKIHTVFKNLFKTIAPPEEWKTLNKRKYLQANLVNLDWCYYYSEESPTFKVSKLPRDLQKALRECFDEPLLRRIAFAEPRWIFAHGKALGDWVTRSTSELKEALKLKNSFGQKCHLFEGKLKNTSIPVYYLEHFINAVNRNSTLKQINHYVNRNHASGVDLPPLRTEKLIEDSQNRVLIVAARKAYPEYQRYGLYICQPNRFFRPSSHLGFYYNREVQPEFPKILNSIESIHIDEEAVHSSKELSAQERERLLAAIGILREEESSRLGTQKKVLFLSESESPETIKLSSPIRNDLASESGCTTAFTQGHRYVTLEAVNNGPDTTTELLRLSGDS